MAKPTSDKDLQLWREYLTKHYASATYFTTNDIRALIARIDAALAVVEVAREWDAHWQPSQASSLGRMLDWKLHEALAAYDQERSDG